jgi:hypothetical protein
VQVNRAWYYASQRCTIEPAKLAEAVALRDAIERLILDFPGYGYRRVTHALHRDGWRVNHKRVLRIMREESLLCHLKRHFVHTTDSHHPYPVYPNLVPGRTPEAPDVIWVADLTYIREAPRVCVPGDDPGCVLAQVCRMECVDPHGYAFDTGCAGRGNSNT